MFRKTERTRSVDMYLPQSWMPLLDILSKSASTSHVTASENWLADARGSAFGTKPMWTELLSDLCHRCPTLDGDSLVFRPLFFLIPINIRHQLLMLIHQHQEEFPISLLKDFIHSIESEPTLLTDWTRMVVRLLNFHCSLSPDYSPSTGNVMSDNFRYPHDGVHSTTVGDGQYLSSHKFSGANANRAAELCDCLKAEVHSSNVEASYATSLWSMSCPVEFDSSVESSQLNDLHSSLCVEMSTSSSSQLSRSHIGGNDANLMDIESSILVGDLPHLNQVALFQPSLLLILESVKERWLLGQATDHLSLFNGLNSAQLLSMWDNIGLSTMPDVAINAACQSFVMASSGLSLGCVTSFAQQCLLPRIVHLEQPASRLLISAIAAFSTTFTRQTVENIVLPIVCNIDCSSFAAELLFKLVRDVFVAEKKLDSLSCVLTELAVWSEHILAVLQLILDSKIELSNDALRQLACSLSTNSAQSVHSSSPKFAKMILSMVNAYGQRLTAADIQLLKTAAECLNTFMKKPILLALSKLRT